MSLTFNGQYLVEKLAKLDSSQLSIQTLSHWCRFHRTKAKQVVETWTRQFHCSPREQRLAFLYLANDILQNSRRKGAEFVVEFWKVLPNAFRDIAENGAQSEKNAAERMIGIWEERKVFDIQGKVLKEELMGQSVEKSNGDGESLSRKLVGVGEERKLLDIQGKVLKNDAPMRRCIEKCNSNGETLSTKLTPSVGNMVDKIVSSYKIVYDGPVDEEALLRKCGKAIAFVDKLDKEIGSDSITGKLNQPELKELQGHHGLLRESIEQLSAAESSRTNLVARLKEALQEQESKLDQIRLQLQAARIRSEQVENICEHLINSKPVDLRTDQTLKETSIADKPQSSTSETLVAGGDDKGTPAPITMHTPEGPPISRNSPKMEEDTPNSAAAAVDAELGAPIVIPNSLASEDNNGDQQNHASTINYPSGKRAKLVNGASSHIESQQLASETLPYPHPESPQHDVAVTHE